MPPLPCLPTRPVLPKVAGTGWAETNDLKTFPCEMPNLEKPSGVSLPFVLPILLLLTHTHTLSLSLSLSAHWLSLSLLTHTWKLCWNFKAKCFTWNLFPNVLPPLFENWAMPHSFHQIVITGRPGLGLFISGDKNQVLFVRWCKNRLFHQKILRCH